MTVVSMTDDGRDPLIRMAAFEHVEGWARCTII
jgi:hypothetical protein